MDGGELTAFSPAHHGGWTAYRQLASSPSLDVKPEMIFIDD
jgi:hypothetical protein